MPLPTSKRHGITRKRKYFMMKNTMLFPVVTSRRKDGMLNKLMECRLVIRYEELRSQSEQRRLRSLTKMNRILLPLRSRNIVKRLMLLMMMKIIWLHQRSKGVRETWRLTIKMRKMWHRHSNIG